MEVGAVKQAFNNEIILLKKNLNQAKTQTINKLTRKAKQLTEKKAPDALKEKFTRKAESAVKEVLILKKVKPRDIAQFIVTHKGQLNDYMNKPLDKDKACARLLLHKSMQQKYKHIREKFSNVSIKDLFMSRQERLKLKKEAREKQKNKKKGKDKEAVNVEGEWDVEMTENNVPKDVVESNINDLSEDENMSNDNDSDGHSDNDVQSDGDTPDEDIGAESDAEERQSNNSEENEDSTDIILNEPKSKSVRTSVKARKSTNGDGDIKIKQKNKKPKENKNRNLNEKLQKRNFHKDSDDNTLRATKMVDPFFITSSGQNYMSLVEPRQPDEVKEVHKQGNRQYRRAVMFGHVPKPKPRKNNYNDRQNNFADSNNFDRQAKKENGFGRNGNKFDQKGNKYDRNNKDVSKDQVPEKLHPSWEAKKKQSSILPFQGKKIVFDES